MKFRIPTIRAAEELPSKPSMGEVGASGMTFGSMGRLQQQEYLTDLVGIKGYRIYERMRRSDPKIAGLRKALDTPIVHAAWDVEPADEKNARSKEIAEFVEECLFDDMDRPWTEVLHEILLYQDFGFSAFEKVWKIEEGKVKLRHLGYLPPRTIYEIDVKNREISSIKQMTNDKGWVDIPGQKLLWFTNRKEGDDFRGIPLLRAMYRPWFNKERAEILLLVMAERMGGWLKFVSPDGATDADLAAAQQIGREFRINETMYMVLPPRWDATVESSTGMTLNDLQSFINYCDMQMDHCAMAQVLGMTSTENGSRALGRTMGELFTEGVQATAEYVRDQFNREDGIIQELIAYNFPDWEEHVPTLTVGKVEKLDIKNWALGYQSLAASGVLFGADTHKWVRDQMGLPPEEKLDEEAGKRALEPPPPPTPFGGGSGKPKGPVPNPNVKKGPYVPPGTGDSNPTSGDVDPQPGQD